MNAADRPVPSPQPKAKNDADLPADEAAKPPSRDDEIGGPKGPEPTRYGDWERKGRCIDF